MDWEWLEKHGQQVMAAKWVILPLVIVAAGGGWWFADYHYRGQIDLLNTALSNKEFPAPAPPVTKTVQVPVADAADAQEIQSLKDQLKSAQDALKKRPVAATLAPKQPGIAAVGVIGNDNDTSGTITGCGIGQALGVNGDRNKSTLDGNLNSNKNCAPNTRPYADVHITGDIPPPGHAPAN